ncbi:hypothetical protein ABTY98_26740 [Streptomyces sp. NPDC096040]|uniref:hypothetical protein n=1 Tax=Streptomyces sp. NPDC096040 TaxID=3155541 RepID=UPI00332B6106
MTVSEDTGAMWAALLMLSALPAVGYALVTRLTGRGRKGGAPRRPGQDPLALAGGGAAVAGQVPAAVTVVEGWDGLSTLLSAEVAGGC